MPFLKDFAPIGAYFLLVSSIFSEISHNIYWMMRMDYLNEMEIFRKDALYFNHINKFAKGVGNLIVALVIINFFDKFFIALWGKLFSFTGSFLLIVSAVFHLPLIYCYLSRNILEALLGRLGVLAINILICNQFNLTYDFSKIELFFLALYFFSLIGNMSLGLLAPFLYSKFSCNHKSACLPLPFGVLLFIAGVVLLFLILGKRYYKKRTFEKFCALRTIQCIITAVKERRGRNVRKSKRRHWLDYSIKKYGDKLVRETKMILNILPICFTVPIFSMSLSQRYTTFKTQTLKLNGLILGTFMDNHILLYIYSTIGSISALIYAFVLFPYSKKHKLVYTPLARIGMSYIFMILTFICALALNIQIEKTDVELPTKGNCQLRIYNTIKTAIIMEKGNLNQHRFTIPSLQLYTKRVPVNGIERIKGNYKIYDVDYSKYFMLEEKKAISYYFSNAQNLSRFEDDVSKDLEFGHPKFRVLIRTNKDVKYSLNNIKTSKIFQSNSKNTSLHRVKPGGYKFVVDNVEKKFIEMRNGGVYAILVDYDNNEVKF